MSDCASGKVSHRTRAAAMIHIHRLKNKGMEAYRCRLCGNWHIANSRKDWKIQMRIDGREAGHGGNNAEIAQRCLEQLRACNALFVWVDRIETIGTMIEIGAGFQRMPIFVAFANRELAGRAYFAAQLAD